MMMKRMSSLSSLKLRPSSMICELSIPLDVYRKWTSLIQKQYALYWNTHEVNMSQN
jgi:hypothetical protein